jgi:nitric oxide reductase NorD protein
MEERVGLWLHGLLQRIAPDGFDDAAVEFPAQAAPLWFRAFGGDAALAVAAGAARGSDHHRALRQRLAGSGARAAPAWLDERALRLPARITRFARAELNRDLYVWLCALAAADAAVGAGDWIVRSQRATRQVLDNYPALRARWTRLRDAELELRLPPRELPPAQRAREQAIREALLRPGSVAALPAAPRPAEPLLLWLHPDAPAAGAAAPTPADAADAARRAAPAADRVRRAAQRVDAPPRGPGLFQPRAEAILSLADYAPMAMQPDDGDADGGAADDLDTLALAAGARAAALRMELDVAAAADDDAAVAADGVALPEWDHRRRVLVDDRCRVREQPSPALPPLAFPPRLDGARRVLRAHFAQLAPPTARRRAQPDGDELDLDRVVQLRAAGGCAQRLYLDRRARRRDLSCLLLADLSLSTDAAADGARRVIDVIRDSLLLFGETLAAGHERFAMYGFSSRGRLDVRWHALKRFDQRYDDDARARVAAIEPGHYTRLGAALRMAARELRGEGSRERLLLLLSDGKPNDRDIYEGRHGIEDTRQAFLEARRAGLRPFCVTVDREAGDYLPYLFGRHHYALVRDAAELPLRLSMLYAQLVRR